MTLADENCRNGASRLDVSELPPLLGALTGWTINDNRLSKHFRFTDFKTALLFANAVGWIAETQNHHPDLEVGWGYCRVTLSTHDAGGLTRNDFIVATRIERVPTA